MASPFNSMFFYLSPKAFLRIAEDAGVPAIQALNLAPGTSRFDRTLKHLGAALLPAFAKPQEACGLFVDHVLYAASAHIARLYGGMQVVKPLAQGGLAAWQEHRAKEILRTNLDGTLELRVLAAELGLSISHFCRAFRKSMGYAPHQWLMHLRVETAKDLLRHPYQSLSDIALACGFADQSHFNRVFKQMTGAPPGVWRRSRYQ